MIQTKGYTLMELLIVVTLIALMSITAFAMLNPQTQIFKGYDTVRKSDLNKLKIAFEAYYSDNDCYPTQEIIDTCDGDELTPYLSKIPCDPSQKTPYHLQASPAICPQSFALFTHLEQGSHPTYFATYNYAVSSNNVDLESLFPTPTPTPTIPPTPTASPTPTATPTPTPGNYYCNNSGTCLTLPPSYSCPEYQIFTNSNCTDSNYPSRNCNNSAYRCTPN